MECHGVTIMCSSMLLFAGFTIFILASWSIQKAHCNVFPHPPLNGCNVLSRTDCTSLNLLNLKGFISFRNTSSAASDWGFMKSYPPAGILYPQHVSDIVSVVRAVSRSNSLLTIAARGHGHSINGQAQVNHPSLPCLALLACCLSYPTSLCTGNLFAWGSLFCTLVQESSWPIFYFSRQENVTRILMRLIRGTFDCSRQWGLILEGYMG
jgi:hypothetical protein